VIAVRSYAALSGLLGGLAWSSAPVADRLDVLGDGEMLRWIGLPLLGLAALGAGAGLVSRSAVALRVLVAVCFAMLAASVVAVLLDAIGTAAYAVVGAVAVVAAVVVLARRPAVPAPVGGHRPGGAHAR
jgi:hypothetical protein